MFYILDLYCSFKIVEILIFIYSILFSYVYGYIIKQKTLILYCTQVRVLPILIIMKYNLLISLSSLTDIVAVDYLNKKGTRFEINYIFWDYVTASRIISKIFIRSFSSILSIIKLYNSADWLERELFDMYGINILGHPNMCRILTDYGFKGNPLRKDFPLTGYIEIGYDDALRIIRSLPIEMAQIPKFYKFNNPWNINF